MAAQQRRSHNLWIIFWIQQPNKYKSCIKDATHFLQLIRDVTDLSADAMLVTLDFEALYPNISTNEGLEAAREALEQSRPGTVKPSNGSLLRLLS